MGQNLCVKKVPFRKSGHILFLFFFNSLHEADHPSLHVLCTCSYCKPIISNLNIIIDQDDEDITD